jgi:hypothetical protein
VLTHRAPLPVKRMAPARAVLTAGILTTIITSTFIAALVSFTHTQTAGAIRAALARPGNLAVTVAGSLSPAQQPQATSVISGQLHRALGTIPFSLYSSLRLDGLALRGGPGRRAGTAGSHRVATVIAADGLAAHAALVSGHWPAAAPGPGLRQVAIPARAAAQLGVSAGQVLTVFSPYDRQEARLRVTGVFRPRDAAGPYWRLDPLHGAGRTQSSGFTTYGPLFTTTAAMQSGPLAAVLGSWVAVTHPAGHVTAGSAQPLGERLAGALNRISASAAANNPTATSPLPRLLTGLSAGLLISHALLLIGLLELLALSGATLILMARCISGERRSETALMRARGGAERQLTALGTAESVLIVVPALIIGPLLGGWLAAGVASGWPPPLTAADFPASAWQVALIIAVVSLLVLLLPSLGTAVSPLGSSVLRGRQRAVGSASRAGADLALVALAGAACWQLAHTTDALGVGAGGSLSLDPILIAAPVLAAPACSVVILRVLPLAARLANVVAARGRRIVVPLASWSIGRRPLRQAGPLLITVISLATAILALSQYQTAQRSTRDSAAFTTGSDYRVDLPFGPLPVGDAGRLATLAGTRAAIPNVQASATLGGTGVTMLGVPAARVAGTVLLRGDLATQPLSALAARITPGGAPPGTALPGRAAQVSVTASLGRAGRRSAISSPQLQLQIRDGAGLYYDVDAGTLPADGRSHTITAPLAAGGHAIYPLTLTGVQVTFARPARQEADRLQVGQIQVTGRTHGPFPRAAATVHDALPAPSVSFVTGPGTGAGAGVAQISWLHRSGPLPAIATRSFLAGTGQRVGSVVTLPVSGAQLRMRIVASVTAFPSVPAGVGGLILDGASLQQALLAAGQAPLPATQWWLRSAGHPDFRGIARGLEVTSRAGQISVAASSPLAVELRRALAAIAIAAIALALAGFAVSLTAARERRGELALLDALGMPVRQLGRMLRAEQLMMVVPSAAAGLALGALLAHLIIPALTLSPAGGRPALPPEVAVPWLAAAGLAAVIAAFPVLLAPLAGRFRDTVAVLRQGARE